MVTGARLSSPDWGGRGGWAADSLGQYPVFHPHTSTLVDTRLQTRPQSREHGGGGHLLRVRALTPLVPPCQQPRPPQLAPFQLPLDIPQVCSAQHWASPCPSPQAMPGGPPLAPQLCLCSRGPRVSPAPAVSTPSSCLQSSRAAPAVRVRPGDLAHSHICPPEPRPASTPTAGTPGPPGLTPPQPIGPGSTAPSFTPVPPLPRPQTGLWEPWDLALPACRMENPRHRATAWLRREGPPLWPALASVLASHPPGRGVSRAKPGFCNVPQRQLGWGLGWGWGVPQWELVGGGLWELWSPRPGDPSLA